MDSSAVKTYLLDLQELIVTRLEQVDGKLFRRDSWDRPQGGGGISCILEEGKVLERGGVAFSHVMGDSMPAAATAHRPELAGRRWEAMGVSLVLHPRNPYAPATHLNVRMFVAMKDGEEPVFWFGGGMDLTPYYGFEEDAVHFHQACKNALTPAEQQQLIAAGAQAITYLMPAHHSTPRWLRGSHDTLAVRLTVHPQAAQLCRGVNSALVSTSANRSGQRPIKTYAQCQRLFGRKVWVLPGRVGKRKKPSTIRAWAGGQIIRK